MLMIMMMMTELTVKMVLMTMHMRLVRVASFFYVHIKGVLYNSRDIRTSKTIWHMESVSCAKKSSPWKIKRNCSMFKNLQKVLVSSLSYTAQAQTLKAPHHCVKGGPCDRLKNQVVSMITSGVTWMKSFSSDKQQASSVIHHRWHVISAMPETIPERDDSPSRSF